MEERRKLTRSTGDKALFGVCGGLAEYFNLDSLVVRLIFVLFTLFYGSGLLFYLIAALVIPKEGAQAVVYSQPGRYTGSDGRQYENKAAAGPEGSASQAEGDEPYSEKPEEAGQATLQPDQQPVLPQQPYDGQPTRQRSPGRLLGVILLSLGGLILFTVFFPYVDRRLILGAAFACIGLYLLIRNR